MSTTRTFMSGRSQAIRIPKEYRLPDEEIFVNRVGETIMLTPVSKLRETFTQSLRLFSDDFMAEGRPAQIPSERDPL
ncbi:MAG: AbrB/MazE/SpoVT family DNA-binding domain-containing protein [Clostridia bacterium]|nr:AbrB/MazE/SpoVT family DNA-binding domain-containing protein [Clostridia bacterium]